MNIIQKNIEDFEIGSSLNKNNHTFYANEKYNGEKLIMKILTFQNKQSRLDAIRQINKYQFLDTNRGYSNYDQNDNFLYNMDKNRDYPENNYINKYKYYAIDQRFDTIDLALFQEPMQQSLEEKISKKQRFDDYFSSKDMKNLVRTIFSSLEYMDNKSLSHFNLKPSNILYTNTSTEEIYKVSDYGFDSTDYKSEQIWEAPEIKDGDGIQGNFLNFQNYETYKEAQNKREFNSLNPNHINYDPIKFDMFRFGLILIQAATFISNEELLYFKQQTNDIEIQKFKDQILETIKERYDDDFYDLVIQLISLNHISRPFPSNIKRTIHSYLSSRYNFLGGPYGKGPQENLNSKFCSEIYQKILDAIIQKKKTPDQYFQKYEMNKGLKTITAQNFDRAIKNLSLKLTNYEQEILEKSLQTDKFNTYSLKILIDTEDTQGFKADGEDKQKIKKLNQQDEQLFIQGILQLNKELNRRGTNINLIFEDRNRISIEFLEQEDFKLQLRLNKLEVPDNVLDLILFKYNINGDGMIACQVFIDDFIAYTQVSDEEYMKTLRDIFSIIRQKHLTLESFFKTYDRNNQKYIVEADFKEFLEDVCYQVPEKLYSLIAENLINYSTGRIYLLNLYQLFIRVIEEILKYFFNSLLKDLSSANTTLQTLLSEYASKSNPQYIQFEKFSQSLSIFRNFQLNSNLTMKQYILFNKIIIERGQQPYVRHEELALYFSLLGIRKDLHGQLDYESLCQTFYEWCEENDVKQFECLCETKLIRKIKNQKEQLQTVKGRIGLLSFQIAGKLKRFKYEDVMAFFGIEKSKDPLMIYNEFNQKVQVIMKLKEDDVISIFKHLDKLGTKQISSIIFLQFANFDIHQIGGQMEQKFVQGIDTREFSRHQPFLEEILTFLEEKNETVDSFFNSESGYMHTVSFRYRLMDLDINLTFFKNQLNDLMSAITLPSDPTNVNIQLFRDLLHYYQQQMIKKTKLQNEGVNFENIHFAIQWFIQIYQQLIQMNLTFQKTFQRYEERLNEISILNLEHVVFNTLKLNRDYAFIFFLKYVQKDKDNASLIKIKQGLDKEETSLKALKEISDISRNQSLNVDAVFNKFNTNKDSTLDMNEFQQLISVLHRDLPEEIVNHLFIRIDLSGDGFITIREFKRAIFGAASEYVQEDEGQFHALFVEDLQITLLRQNQGLEELLRDIIFKDIISIQDFLSRLSSIGYDLKKNKLKIDAVLNRIKKDNISVYYQEFRSLYLEYKKDEAELRRKGLISEQEEKEILAYGQLIRREMQRNKHTFDIIFRSKKLKNTEFITEQQIKNYFLFDLELNDDEEMKNFLEHLKNISGSKRTELINLDDLEKLIYGYSQNESNNKTKVEEVNNSNNKKESDAAKEYAITINQNLLDELIQFIFKNMHMKKELDQIDSTKRKNIERRSGQVTADEFKKVVNEAGRYVRLEDIIQLANYFGCNQNGVFYYKRLLEEIEREVKLRNVMSNREVQVKDFSIEFKQLCLRVKRDLKEKGFNIVELVHKYYSQLTDHWIYESDLWLAFKSEGIHLDHEQNKKFVQSLPYKNGKLDYKVFNELIFEYFSDDNKLLQNTAGQSDDEEEVYEGGKKVRMIINEDVRDLFREIRKEFQLYMQREEIPLLVLFKRLDLEGDDCISFTEFVKGIKKLFPQINLSNQELVLAVFNRFDRSHDTQIGYQEFAAAINEDNRDVQIKPLLKKIKNILDLKTEEEMRKEFEFIDIDKNGTLNFGEFSQALRAIDFRFNQDEIKAIFDYFDKEDKKQISYHYFISVLNEDHMNFLKIREKIFEYLKNSNTPMEYFFKRYVMEQQQYLENCVMSYEMFKRMIRDLGFNFDSHQVEELFCYIDENKNFYITIEEFKNKVFECKIDMNKALRNIRRAIIHAEFDIEEAFKTKDIHKTGTVPYHIWAKMLKQYGVEVRPLEMEAIFKFYSDNKEKELDYTEFINGMICQIFNIEDIQDKIVKMCKKYKTEPDKLFELFDEKKDGMLDLHEFAQMLENLQVILSNDELKEAYQVFDLNKDGQINANEFRAIIEGRTYSNKISLQQIISQNYYQKQTMNYNNLHNLIKQTGFDPKAPKQIGQNSSQVQMQQIHIASRQKDSSYSPQKLQKFDSMVEIQGMSPDQSEIGSPLRSSSITKLKMQPTSLKRRQGLPNFNLDSYIMLLVQYAKEDNISIFDLFSQFDENKNFKFYISGVQKIFQQLRIDADEKHIGQFFQSSTQGNDGCFYYVPILKKIMSPSALISSIIVFSIKANGLKPQQYFKLVRENSPSEMTDMDHWSLGEILFLNKNLGLDLDRMYLQQGWNDWLLVAGHQNRIDVKDFLELLGTDAIIMGGDEVFSDNQSEGDLKKIEEEIINQLRIIYEKYDINLHDVFNYYDTKKDYSIESSAILAKIFSALYMEVTKNNTEHFFNSYKDNTGKFRYILFLKKIMNIELLMKSVLINVMQANKLSYKNFFETLKTQTNRTVYWGVDELQRISKSFNFQISQEDLEEIIFQWGQKVKGKLSIFEIAVALSLSIDLSAQDVETIYKEQIKKTFQKLKDCKREIEKSLEQEQQIMTMHFGTVGNFDENEKRQIKDYVNELSQYINDHNFFDPFESMAKNGQLNFNDIYEALKNGYSIFQNQDDIKLLARWLSADGPILLSELSKLLKYDAEAKKREEIKEKDKNEKLNQGINISNYVREEVNDQEAEICLNSLIDTFKKNITTLLSVYFGDDDYIISCEEFIQVTTNATTQIGVKQALNLFYYLDVNGSGTLTKNEMMLFFNNSVTKTTKEEQYEKIRASKDIQTQIQQIFNEVDKDGNQYVDNNEFDNLLRAIGLFCSPQELEQYFLNFDANKDGKISFGEFKAVVEEKLMNEVMVAEDIVDDLRKQFQIADINNSRVLNKPQLGQVFLNLGVVLSNQELNEIFNVIDVDKSSTIDIDEFLMFINNNGQNFTGLATNVLLNIRSSRTMSIQDMKYLFSAFPSGFQISFTRKKTKKRINLPSATLKPKLNNYDIYEGIRYEHKEIHNRMRTKSLIDRKFIPHKLNVEIKLDIATGIPIPKEQVPSEDIVSRHVYISLFNKQKKQLFGNTCRIPAKWDPNYEDRWYFKKENVFENTIIARHANYDQVQDKDIVVCIEFCLGIKYNNQKAKSLSNKNKQRMYQSDVIQQYEQFAVSTPDFEVSCCYGLITLPELQQSGVKTITLNGGTPIREMNIEKQDIKARRSGWRSVVKAVTKSITTQLKLEVVRSFPHEELLDICTLPDVIIFPKKSLSLIKSFREYMVAKSIRPDLTLNTKMHNLIEVKTFCRCVDCPDIFIPLSTFWKEQVVPHIKDYNKELDTFATFMQKINILLYHKGFRFNISDPAATYYSFPEIVQSRQDLLQSILIECKRLCQLDKKEKPSAAQQAQDQAIGFQLLNCYETFNVMDVMSDDEDSDFDMLQNYFSTKNKQNKNNNDDDEDNQ